MTTEKKTIKAKIREKKGGRDGEVIPAVLYGAKRESTLLSLNKRELDKLYKEAGESTLVDLEIDGMEEKPAVLIYGIQKDPLSGEVIHVDFFEPNLKEEVEAEIPLVFIGESPAVKDLDGTLVKNFHSINVKALPQSLPHEVEIDTGQLKKLDDVIHIEDIKLPTEVEVLHDPKGVVAMISRPENVEEELEKPIEEGGEAEVVGEKEREAAAEEKDDNKEQEEEKDKEVGSEPQE